MPLLATTFTGYRLRDAVAARMQAARGEQLAGDNPEALLFPPAEGGLLWYTGFAADHLRPAMIEAGWPLQDWVETRADWDADAKAYTTIERQRVMSVLPWHGLRHRFARTMIDHYDMERGQLMAIGGWESIETVNARYYRSGKENATAALAAIERRDATVAAEPPAIPGPIPELSGTPGAAADAIRAAMALLERALPSTDPDAGDRVGGRPD